MWRWVLGVVLGRVCGAEWRQVTVRELAAAAERVCGTSWAALTARHEGPRPRVAASSVPPAHQEDEHMRYAGMPKGQEHKYCFRCPPSRV